MINSIGLQNIGVEAFVSEKVPELRRVATPYIVNVFGYATDDYVDVVRRLDNVDGPAAYELNVSCPNTKHGGMFFGSDPGLLSELVAAVRATTSRRLIVKLSPNVARIEPLARAAEESGADAISLVNTFVSLAIDARARRPRIGAGFGGLSGPAIKPIALRMVFQVHRAGVPLPISGIGGIQDATDAIEFFLAGATTVQVGTQSFVDPDASGHIVRDLQARLAADGISDVRELIGALRVS
jgi:dihydroorotate dehydrogenase (NAD+) catalytic subunit